MELNRVRLSRVVKYLKKGWDMVLLTEFSDDSENIL